MTSTNSTVVPPKGRQFGYRSGSHSGSSGMMMKCFKCRQSCSRTDGGWHEGGTDQVYLCKSCGIAHQAALKKKA
jgi:hypothetical protein